MTVVSIALIQYQIVETVLAPPFQYLPTPTASASCLTVEMTTTELSGSAYSQCKQPLMEGTGEFPFLPFKGSFC